MFANRQLYCNFPFFVVSSSLVLTSVSRSCSFFYIIMDQEVSITKDNIVFVVITRLYQREGYDF